MLKGQHRFGTKKGSGVGLRAHNDVSNHGIHILWKAIKYECEKARGPHSEKLDLGRKAKKGEEEEFSTSGTRETEVFHLLLQTCCWVFLVLNTSRVVRWVSNPFLRTSICQKTVKGEHEDRRLPGCKVIEPIAECDIKMRSVSSYCYIWL